MPHTKRQKMHGENSAHLHDRIFASRTASFRRADSLKSVEGVDDGKACILHLSHRVCRNDNDNDYDLTNTQGGCVPTVPATPVPQLKARGKAAASARPFMDPVPIIAPPHDYVPRLPLSSETLAKIRLGKFLEREGRGREKDGLPVSSWGCSITSCAESDEDEEECEEDRDDLIEWEVALGIGQHAREEVIDWILDVRLFPKLSVRH